MLRTLLLFTVLFFYASSHAQNSVLVAECSSWVSTNLTLVPYDSAIYKHSGNRNTNVTLSTSHTTPGSCRYDTATSYYLSFGAPILELRTQRFDNDDSITEFTFSEYDTLLKAFKPHSWEKYKRNANKQPDTFLQTYYINGNWVDAGRTSYVYDPVSLQIREKKFMGIDNTLWKDYSIDSFYYDGAGQLLVHKDSNIIAQFGPYTFMHIYGYSTGKLIADTTLLDGGYTELKQYTYDANGMKDSEIRRYFDGGVWKNNVYYAYFYNTSGLLHYTLSYSWNINLQTFVPGNKREYLYDANNNLQSITDYPLNTASQTNLPTRRDTMVYNTHNQLLSVTRNESFQNGKWVYTSSTQISRYYYGTFPGNVEDIYTDSKMTLYPVPATTYINLDLNFDKPQSIAVIIFDMQGRMVKQFTDKAEKAYHKNIIVQDMPAGQYMLQVRSDAGVETRNFTVIR